MAWDDGHYVKAYVLCSQGASKAEVARVLGMGRAAWDAAWDRRPAFREACRLGRAAREASGATFEEYVYKRMSAPMQALWDRLRSFVQEKNGLLLAQNLLGQHGVKARMQMYAHAIVATHFSKSRAMRMCGLSKKVVDKWEQNYPEFADLLAEIEYHKKNFFEDALMKLVRQGDIAATIFVNKTQNRDRGYDTKVTVEHTGTVNHNHIDLTKLDLSLETKREIAEAIRRYRAAQLAAVEGAAPAPAPVLEGRFLPTNKELADAG